MKILNCLFLITLIVFQSLSLNFKLIGTKPLCMRFQGGSRYTLEYVVSGIEDQNVQCTIKQVERLITNQIAGSQFKFTADYSTDPIEICFKTTDGIDKQIAFDFYQVNDPLRLIISKDDVTLVQAALRQAENQLQQISRNQQFHIQRDEIHKQTLEQSQNKIKWTGIIKILFLLGSALIQLWIMKGFFTSNNPYQPVQSV